MQAQERDKRRGYLPCRSMALYLKMQVHVACFDSGCPEVRLLPSFSWLVSRSLHSGKRAPWGPAVQDLGQGS